MTKGKIIGYIGIVLIIIISVFLGTKYYLYTKKSEVDKKPNTEIIKYSNLICNKNDDTDNYSQNNIITIAFDKNNLVWLRDLSAYYYFDNDKYTTAKNELNTTKSGIYKNSYDDDGLIITTIYEGEINDLKNDNWNTDINTYTYDNLIKYYQDKEYTCELNN